MYGLGFLSDVLQFDLLTLLPKLETLDVRRCDRVKTIFDVKCTTQDRKMKTMEPAALFPLPFHLKILTLKWLPNLENVWNEDPHGILGMQLLQEVHIEKCESLTSLFPASVAKDLVKLEVQDCKELMEIVAEDDNVDPNGTNLELTLPCPCVRSLKLKGLPKFKYFCYCSLWCDILKTYTLLEPHTEDQVCIEKSWIFNFPNQGSTLSPYLFTLILDVLTEQIQEIAPKCMLFADDIVLLGESREELNERLETWRRALETHGFRLSRSKSEYMECKFNKRRRISNSEVKIGDHIIPQVTRFKYLGSVIQDDGEIEGDVNHRIQAGWMKWRKASGVLCDAKVPIKLKGKFYRTAVRPAILYGTECWAVKSQHENKVGVAEMRMLRWMCGKTRQDKIRNEAIRERVGVAPIVEKMVENRLRWFGHVERRPVDSVVRRVDQMERKQTIRGRGRPKKTIREVIKKDLEINGLDRSMLKALHLESLEDLVSIGLDNSWIEPFLRNLETLEECDLNLAVRRTFDEKISAHAGFVSCLILRDNPLLQEIWHDSLPIPDLCFRYLHSLIVDGCQFLSEVLPFNLLPLLPKLETLEVRKCDSVKIIFDVKCTITLDRIVTTMGPASFPLPFPLKKLTLSELPNVENVWNEDPRRILRIQLLQEVHVDKCECLASVFPASVAQDLVKLETLVVQHCEELMAIVADPRGTNPEIKFPCLKSLMLLDLPKFKYNGICCIRDATMTFEVWALLSLIQLIT
ncbi:hypothetical protein HKD37_02G005287 [Glycine soja]